MSDMKDLLRYQEADIRYDKLEAALRSSQNSKRLAKVRQFLEEQKSVLQKMTASVETRKQAIQATSDRFDLYEKRYRETMEKYQTVDKEDLETVAKYSRYFDQLSARIAAERREFTQFVNVLEKEERQLADMRIKIAKARKEYDDLKVQVEEERAASKDELDAARAEADGLAAAVDPTMLEEYKRVKRNHAVPVAEVVGNKCSGCNMELPAVALRKLKEQEMVECDNCGRLLYVTQ